VNRTDKFIIVVAVIIFSIGYYCSSIYIPYYIFFYDDFIDIDKYPDLWKWSPSILSLIASLIILVLAYVSVNFAKNIFPFSSSFKQIEGVNKYTLFFLSILGGVIFVCIQHFVYSSLANEITNSEPNSFELWYLPVLISSCCIYPIAEEVFFRKGILFASIHYPNYRQMVTTWIGGILLGMLYKKSGSLIYPITFHISWNITVTLLNFIPVF